MDGADAEGWSDAASGWSRYWGGFSQPARLAVLDAAGVRPGDRVLDVGCGSGEFLELLAARGIRAAGIDPAPEMIALARRHAPDAELVVGTAEALPWADAAFDLVTAFNALHFADDVDAALAEAVRTTRPGGAVAVANWAEGSRNELEVIEQAVADAVDETLPPDGELREPGGLERLLAEGGLVELRAGLVPLDWVARDDAALVAGILLGEDDETIEELRPVVVAAARPFREPGGAYRLRNAFRFAAGRRPIS